MGVSTGVRIARSDWIKRCGCTQRIEKELGITLGLAYIQAPSCLPISCIRLLAPTPFQCEGIPCWRTSCRASDPSTWWAASAITDFQASSIEALRPSERAATTLRHPPERGRLASASWEPRWQRDAGLALAMPICVRVASSCRSWVAMLPREPVGWGLSAVGSAHAA